MPARRTHARQTGAETAAGSPPGRARTAGRSAPERGVPATRWSRSVGLPVATSGLVTAPISVGEAAPDGILGSAGQGAQHAHDAIHPAGHGLTPGQSG